MLSNKVSQFLQDYAIGHYSECEGHTFDEENEILFFEFWHPTQNHRVHSPVYIKGWIPLHYYLSWSTKTKTVVR